MIGPGSFYTSLMPIFLVKGAAEAVRAVRGPIVLVTNLLTEGRGMAGFTAADAVRTLGDTIGRPVDVVIVNTARPSAATLERYAQEDKAPLEIGDVPAGLRDRHRRILVQRDRASRSAPPGPGGVGRPRSPVTLSSLSTPNAQGPTPK